MNTNINTINQNLRDFDIYTGVHHSGEHPDLGSFNTGFIKTLNIILAKHKMSVRGYSFTYRLARAKGYDVDNPAHIRTILEHIDTRNEDTAPPKQTEHYTIVTYMGDTDVLDLTDYKDITTSPLEKTYLMLRELAGYRDIENPISKILINEKEKILLQLSTTANSSSYPIELDSISYRTNAEQVLSIFLLPVFFKSFKAHLDKEELALFKTLADYRNSTRNTIEEQWQKLLESPDYKKLIRVQELAVIQEAIYTGRVNRVTRQVQDTQNTIQTRESQLRDKYNELRVLRKELLIIENSTTDIDEDFNYILDHPYFINIEHQERGTGHLRFLVRIPLSNWNEEEADMVIRNPRTYGSIEDRALENKIRTLLTALLIEQDAKLWYLGMFEIALNLEGYNVIRMSNIMQSSSRTTLMKQYKAGYNTHIEHYSCIGSHSTNINKALSEGHWPTLFEAILGPYKNWNISDGIVTREFINSVLPRFIRDSIPCIEYKGSMLSINEFLNKYKKDKKKEGEQE